MWKSTLCFFTRNQQKYYYGLFINIFRKSVFILNDSNYAEFFLKKTEIDHILIVFNTRFCQNLWKIVFRCWDSGSWIIKTRKSIRGMEYWVEYPIKYFSTNYISFAKLVVILNCFRFKNMTLVDPKKQGFSRKVFGLAWIFLYL